MDKTIAKAIETHNLDKEELVYLLKSKDDLEEELLHAADSVREKYVGNEVHLRGLIEFSNICKNNCCYCGIRRDNKNAVRYRLQPEEIISLASQAKDYGFKTIVMQSGEDLFFTTEKMQYIISAIKKMDMAVTLSIGEKTFEEYKAYREAGADRYLLRIETTDKDLYHRLDPGMSWEIRRQCLLDLRELGYEVGSGSMVGLPGQSIESVADDILFFKKLNLDMAGIGPFIPHKDTPLADAEGRAFKLSLKTMALTRLLLPDINIPATTAMEALHPQGRLIALQSGANVVMPNVTESEYRKYYELYPGKTGINDTPLHCRTDIGLKIQSIGRTVSQGYGFRGDYARQTSSKQQIKLQYYTEKHQR